MIYAPIALFVYNRPSHTRQTVEALLKNELARHSDLFIFSDAVKNSLGSDAVRDVREYIRSIIGFKSVNILLRDENWGLARSIIAGVSQICEEFGRVIVLEDDLVSSPHFLTYMNDALNLYADMPEVMHISGSTYPVEANDSVKSYFLHLPLCWGWATWSRAWRHFDKDIKVMERFDSQMISRFNFDGSFSNYWEQLELNRNGSIDTWFVFWYATVFLRKGLVLFPGHSLIRNIGMDGTGVHLENVGEFHKELSIAPISLANIAMEESVEAFNRHKRYFNSCKPTVIARMRRKISHLIRGLR